MILAAALAIEVFAGYPPWLFRTIGHPVTWIGALVGTLDRLLNRQEHSHQDRRRAGVMSGSGSPTWGSPAWMMTGADAKST